LYKTEIHSVFWSFLLSAKAGRAHQEIKWVAKTYFIITLK